MRLAFDKSCDDDEAVDESGDEDGEKEFGRCRLRGRGLSSSSMSCIMDAASKSEWLSRLTFVTLRVFGICSDINASRIMRSRVHCQHAYG